MVILHPGHLMATPCMHVCEASGRTVIQATFMCVSQCASGYSGISVIQAVWWYLHACVCV